MQAIRMNADVKAINKKIRVYSRLKTRVIRVLFFFGTRIKRMQAIRMNADVKAIKKNPRLSAIENPRYPRSILFGTRMTRMQATRMNADVKAINKKIRVYSRLKTRVIRVLFFWNADETNACNTDKCRY